MKESVVGYCWSSAKRQWWKPSEASTGFKLGNMQGFNILLAIKSGFKGNKLWLLSLCPPSKIVKLERANKEEKLGNYNKFLRRNLLYVVVPKRLHLVRHKFRAKYLVCSRSYSFSVQANMDSKVRLSGYENGQVSLQTVQTIALQ